MLHVVRCHATPGGPTRVVLLPRGSRSAALPAGKACRYHARPALPGSCTSCPHPHAASDMPSRSTGRPADRARPFRQSSRPLRSPSSEAANMVRAKARGSTRPGTPATASSRRPRDRCPEAGIRVLQELLGDWMRMRSPSASWGVRIFRNSVAPQQQVAPARKFPLFTAGRSDPSVLTAERLHRRVAEHAFRVPKSAQTRNPCAKSYRFDATSSLAPCPEASFVRYSGSTSRRVASGAELTREEHK